MATSKTKKEKTASTDAPVTTDLSFTHGDRTYKVIKGATVPMPNGAVKMTAADIAAETSVHKYLVENKCSCIEEVIG